MTRAWAAWRRAWPGLLLLAALVLLGTDAWRWREARAFNAAIAGQGSAAQALQSGTPAQAFAEASRLGSRGPLSLALALYLRAAADPRLAPAAHYNSGNLHMREALALAADGKLAQNPQPLELAKRQYREALRRQPDFWPARYNLERALWLAPELDTDEPPEGPRRNAERAATTMRGFTLGLP